MSLDPGSLYCRVTSVRLVVRATMEDNRKRVPLVLAKGQVWKTERGYVSIERVGKRIIEYRLLYPAWPRIRRITDG